MTSDQVGADRAADDTWIPSACSLCYNQCGIRVHRQNGVVVEIEERCP